MQKEIWAVELRLLCIVADVDVSGQRVPGTAKTEHVVLQHYDGSRPKHEAKVLYEACDALMMVRGRHGE